jgi:Tfp pilus assembly protein PilN
MHTVSIENGVLSPIEHAEQLVVEISKAVTYDVRKHGGRRPDQDTPLFLTGEISCDEGVRDLIQMELGYPTKPLTPPVTLQRSLPVHLYSTNLGLALKYTSDPEIVPQEGNSYSDIDLDILSGRHTRPRKRLPYISLLVPLVLAVTIGFVPPIQQAGVEHDAENLRLQNELDIVNRQLQEVRLSAEKAGQIQSEIDYVYRQLEAVQEGRQALFGNQGGFGDDLVKVINALPLESCFTSIKLLPEQILVTGRADNALQVIDFTTNLKQSGFSSNIRTSEIGETSAMDGVTFEVIIDR